MYLKTEGLILRETDYKDTDKLLTVLTKDRGQLTLRARGCRSKGSKIKSGCQLMAFSEFTVFENRGYMVVDEAVPIELFMPLRNDIEALALASYFTQAAEILSQEDEPNPELLSLTLNSLFALSKGRKSQREYQMVMDGLLSDGTPGGIHRCPARFPENPGSSRHGQSVPPDRHTVTAWKNHGWS